jgi:hypothetical protein
LELRHATQVGPRIQLASGLRQFRTKPTPFAGVFALGDSNVVEFLTGTTLPKLPLIVVGELFTMWDRASTAFPHELLDVAHVLVHDRRR